MDIFDGLTALGGLCLFLFGMQIMARRCSAGPGDGWRACCGG